MAQFTFTNNTYAGSALAGFMASTLLEGDSVKRGLITVINNVKARKILLDVDDDAILQDPSGMFHDQGTTATQNETYLDPVTYEFMKQEQWDKLIQSWEVDDIAQGSMADYDGVVDLRDFMVARYTTKLQIANERLYWLGKSATPLVNQFTASYPGLLPSIGAATGPSKVTLSTTNYGGMSASAIDATGVVTVADTSKLLDNDVVTITVTAGSIKETTNVTGGVALLNLPFSYSIQVLSSTTFKLVRNYNDVNTRKPTTFTGTATGATVAYINQSNVIKVLGVVYSGFDYSVREQDDFKVMIPLHVAYAYRAAQAAAGLNVLGAFADVQKMDYLGITLEVMKQWQANTILGARTTNLFLGVDLLSDVSSLKVVNLSDATLDNVIRMKARMKSAVNFKFANELFYLSA